MSKPIRPTHKDELFHAHTTKLNDWSEGVELPVLEEVWEEMKEEEQIAQALLHGDFLVSDQASQQATSPWAQWLRWLLPLTGAVAAVAIAMVFQLQPQPTKPGKQSTLRAKGTELPKATLVVLRSKLGQGQQGTFLKKDDVVPQTESISLGFRLAPPGGFVNIAWLRQGEPLAWLYQSKHPDTPAAAHYLKRGKEIIKFPLSNESPGEVCLLLLQTKHKLLPTNQPPPLLIKEPKRAPHPISQDNLVASVRFCFAIQNKSNVKSTP